jgi:hypothetical protein
MKKIQSGLVYYKFAYNFGSLLLINLEKKGKSNRDEYFNTTDGEV